MRKMAVELATGKDGKQGGGLRENGISPDFPTCPEGADRGARARPRWMGGLGRFVRFRVTGSWRPVGARVAGVWSGRGWSHRSRSLSVAVPATSTRATFGR